MIGELWAFLYSILESSWSMLNSSSTWMVFSFFVAGVLHEFLKPERLQKLSIASKSPWGIFWTTMTGMCIPICSCGTIPLGISLYYSGAYLGPTLAFMASSPMINPMALMLSWGLLGPHITVISVITGFIAPMLIGLIANRFAKDELHIGINPIHVKKEEAIQIAKEMDQDHDCGCGCGCDCDCDNEEEDEAPAMIQLEYEEPSFWEKIKTGVRWAFTELSVTISKYTVSGMLVAGFIFTVVPQSFVQDYLGNPGMISLLGITAVAALMYVCAVGHIPFIAALVAAGAAPGVAITFLMAGAGTNIPELVTISKTIGKRAMLMYFGLICIISNTVGWITNQLLMPGFEPVVDFDRTSHTIEQVNHYMIAFPEWGEWVCSSVLVLYALYSLYKTIRGKLKKA